MITQTNIVPGIGCGNAGNGRCGRRGLLGGKVESVVICKGVASIVFYRVGRYINVIGNTVV